MMKVLIVAVPLAAIGLLTACGNQPARPAPTVTVTQTVTTAPGSVPSSSPSTGVDLAADAAEYERDGTGSTLCVDAADGALDTAQQENYIYQAAGDPNAFASGDVLTPRQARTVMIMVMNKLCPQLTSKFTFNPPMGA